jgi:hypothetical protein
MIEHVIGQLFYLGPLVMLGGAVAIIVFYLVYRRAPEPKQQPSIGRYFLGAIMFGVVGYVIGTALGIGAACFAVDAGNLCGLIGVFGVGPLLSGSAMFVYGLRWMKQARTAPSSR